ncbi:MAG: hypothetical protein ACRDRI_22120 [Pseudonocardiaceae bacterium]
MYYELIAALAASDATLAACVVQGDVYNSHHYITCTGEHPGSSTRGARRLL